MNLTLPAKSVPSKSFSDYTILLYGERKIGKTTLFSEFEDPFFLMFEPGGKSLAVKQAFCKDWDTFLGYVSLLEKTPNYCKTGIIDTGHMCYERCFEHCLKKLGLINPQDKAWGTAWKFIDKEFRDAHTRLYSTGLGFGVTAHSEIKEVQERSGAKYSKLTMQLGGQAFRYYAGTMDLNCYYQYDNEGKRVLTIRGDAFVEAGSRIRGHFFYKGTKEEITNIPMGMTEKEAYANLIKAFNNELEKPATSKVSKLARIIKK